MKKKAVGIILMTVVLLSSTGCSSQVQATNAQAESNTTVAMENDITIEEESGLIVEELPSVELETPETLETEEPVYTEYTDLFLADNFSKLDKETLEPVDKDSLINVDEVYFISESTDLYNYEGTWMGYSKPDIKVTLFKTNDKWAEVSFTEYVLYVPRESFDLVAMSETDKNALLAQAETPASKEEKPSVEKPKTETPVTSEPVVVEPATTKPVAVEPEPVVVEPEPVVVESNKYTPEEAIAVYRSIMEANGISWNPSLKNGGSWGTGWIYLTKGDAESAANASIESFRMGDGDGIPWKSYYLEVTGSDENAVYYTKWHN